MQPQQDELAASGSCWALHVLTDGMGFVTHPACYILLPAWSMIADQQPRGPLNLPQCGSLSCRAVTPCLAAV